MSNCADTERSLELKKRMSNKEERSQTLYFCLSGTCVSQCQSGTIGTASLSLRTAGMFDTAASIQCMTEVSAILGNTAEQGRCRFLV